MSWLADLVLITHLLFVMFVVGGLVVIWLGIWRHWEWIHNARFRITHLVAILFVAIESIMGKMCPLTIWEDQLRGTHHAQPGFIQRWVSHILFYDFPEWVFTSIYVSFALIVAATFWFARPQFRSKN